MSGAFEYAWALLKSVDFSDIAPMPTRFITHPDSVRYGETKPIGLTDPFTQLYERDPKREQEYMEETYIPDLQSMLEREAMIQAMKNLQLPSTSIQQRRGHWTNQQLPDEQLQNFATLEMMRNRDWDMDNLPEYIPERYH